MSVLAAMNAFKRSLENKGLILSDTSQKFYDLLCEATCASYIAAMHKKRVLFKRRVRDPPKGWTNTIEGMWMDHLETLVLSDAFWDSFWRAIDAAQWEQTVPEWRGYMQFVMLNCVQRDMHLLEDDGLIAKTNDGEFVRAEEYEPQADYDE